VQILGRVYTLQLWFIVYTGIQQDSFDSLGRGKFQSYLDFPFNRNIFPVNVFSPAATISRSLPENVSESLVVDGNEENLKHRPTAELTEEEPLADKVNIDSMESSPTVQPDIQSTADDGPITDSGELTAADDDCSRVDLCTSILQYMTGVACYLLNLVNMKLLNIYHVRA